MNFNNKNKDLGESARQNWGKVSNKSPGERYNYT